MKRPTQVIIFDFDGTIADSFAVMLRTIHQQLGRPFDKDDVSRLRGMSSREVLKELRIPIWRALFLAAKTRRLLGNHLDEITLIPGIGEALKTLSQEYPLFILSANSVTNVRTFLELRGIESYFKGVYGGVAPWRKSGALRKLIREHKLALEETWYVGDGDLDIKAAHHVGIKSVAVTWGFSNPHVLKKCAPDALVFSSDELIQCFLKKEQ